MLGDSTSSFAGPLVVVSTAVNGMVAGDAIGTWSVNVESAYWGSGVYRWVGAILL
jgi:hypothetical protein|tara:strand:- start:6114 stop:6278 length:165 start_codon:yes stop_codon:yes gene_type:complete